MIINHNIAGINAYNKSNDNSINASKAMNKLSSGLRINSAADDAAGSTISQGMKAQIRGLQQCMRNIQDGVSLIHTAESGLASIVDPNLLRLRELAVQAANGTLSDTDLQKIQQEVDQILRGIDNIANNTEFNGIKLLNGSNPNTSSIQTNVEEFAFDYKDVLKLPTPNATGQLSLFTDKGYPTTIEDDNKRLVFGAGNTSYPSVVVDGTNYYFQNHSSSNPSGTTINILSNGIVGDKYITTYKVTDTANNVDLEVTQTVGIVADKYEIRYDIKNDSTITSEVGFQFNLDTDVADDDSAKFMVGGAVIAQEKLYSGSGVPDSFNVYNQFGSTNKIQACGILKTQDNPYNSSIKYEILEEPSKFGIGQWSSHEIEKNNWVPPASSNYGDSAYSIWYEEKDLANGETRSVNTFYGLSVPSTITQPDPVVIEHPFDIKLQVGANTGNEFRMLLSDVRVEKLFEDGTSLKTIDDASKLIKYVDIAMQKVSDERTKFGAYENALEHIQGNVSNYESNISKAESNISDADMAKESMKYTKYKILGQASQAMLTQAKNLPQQVLQIMAPKNQEI